MMNKITIKNARRVAKERGGSCLSEELTGSPSRAILHWKCRKGHEWETRAYNVIREGTWCPVCARKRDCIEKMHTIAKSRSGKCLSEMFTNHHTKLVWECGEGHRWEAEPSSIIHGGTWCPYCVGKNQTLDDLKLIASERGGKCLSKKYKGSNVKYKWECAVGHRWIATANSVKYGTWCFECVRNKDALNRRCKTLEKVKQVALANGGQCLSKIEEYNRAQTPVKLRCQHGHEWSCLPNNIIHKKSWCPECYVPKLKRTIEEMRVIAKERGGECLSERYIATDRPLLWRCRKGHEFKLSAKVVINKNSWCRECKYQEISINDAINLARERGGQLLSNTVKSTQSLLSWECSNGHRWRTNFLNAREKWCLECMAMAETFDTR